MYQGLQADIAAVMPELISTGLLVSLCTIQQPSGGTTPDGVPNNVFTNVAGLVNIPCMDAVLSPGSIEATEAKELEDIMAKSYRHVTLNGWYPQCIPGVATGWRAIVDGVTYDILGAEQDSQNTQTRLKCELVTL